MYLVFVSLFVMLSIPLHCTSSILHLSLTVKCLLAVLAMWVVGKKYASIHSNPLYQITWERAKNSL